MTQKSLAFIIGIVLLVIIGGWLLYAYYGQIQNMLNPQTFSESPNDDTKTIQAEYSQIPDDSSATNEMNSLDMQIQGF